jgi:inorganic pyrophosphatase
VDGKVVAVPTSKILPMYDHWKDIEDVNAMRRNAIAHFFEHYKDLEKGKWVKVAGWGDLEEARAEILKAAETYKAGK